MKNFYYFATISIVIFYSSSNAQWVQTDGPSNGYVLAFAVNNINLFAGTSDGFTGISGSVFLSTNNGTNWTAVNNGMANNRVNALAISGSNLFVGTPYGIFLSTNNGTSWTDLNAGFSNNDVRAFAVLGTNLFAGTYGGVYRSTNNGTSWTSAGFASSIVIAFAVSGTNLFAGTFAYGIYRSTNYGASWTAVDSNLTGNHVPSLAVSGTNLFAGTNAGVFLSTNYGTSWTATDLQNSIVSVLAFNDTNLFAGTSDDILGNSGGVFLSTNNGTNWTAVNTGLPNIAVFALAISGTNLFAGTSGNGVWRRPLSDMITAVENRSIEISSQFILEQNYPNPFNPSTTIRYAIPLLGGDERGGLVTLTVYDVLGNEIATLVNEEKPVGINEINFNASSAPGGLPSGIYFYKLQVYSATSGAGSFVQTRKMILLK